MKPLVDIDTFIKIFNNQKYRKKLDKIILNFFGLDNNIAINDEDINKKEVTLEFYILIDKQFIFKIKIIDKERIFKEPKKFYLNFSHQDSNKPYYLLYPCYWEIYCNYCLKNKNKTKPITLLAALLSSKKICEIKLILNKMKVFNYSEMNDIINMIDSKN
jgi:hypothetical protein